MSKVWILLGIVGLLVSGCQKTAQEPKTHDKQVTYDTFGAAITEEHALPLSEIMAQPEAYIDKPVKVKAKVVDVCQMKGCWMALDAGEGRTIRVTFKDYGFFVPKDIHGREVVLQGTLVKKTMSVEELRHLAEDAGKSEEEIEAIQEPETQWEFVAEGVLIAQQHTETRT